MTHEQTAPTKDAIDRMGEPLRALLLHGISQAGSHEFSDVMLVIEEQLNEDQYTQAHDFLKWLVRNDLTVGHGTIDLRGWEFQNNVKPMTSDEACKWAMHSAEKVR